MYFVHPQLKLDRLNRADLKQKLKPYFSDKNMIFTDMGRSAFKIIIEKLNLQNSEILMPAYICDIFTPILSKYNIKPIFLDIDLATFHLKIEEMEKKITSQTKAILVCHTYGLPFNIKMIGTSSNSNLSNLLIIEDCAHSFGANTGNDGDASFFSLYKQFPTLRGGMLVCPKDWEISLSETYFNFRDFISFLNCFPIFAYFFKRFGGRIAPKMLRKEKLSQPSQINKFSLNLFSATLDDFEKSLQRRKKTALLFQKKLQAMDFETQEAKDNVFCYLSALVPEKLKEKRDQIVQNLRKYKIFCNRIWHSPIILKEEIQKEYGINLKEFPNTLTAAQRIINFPLQNHYTEKDIQRMINSIHKVIIKL